MLSSDVSLVQPFGFLCGKSQGHCAVRRERHFDRRGNARSAGNLLLDFGPDGFLTGASLLI